MTDEDQKLKECAGHGCGNHLTLDDGDFCRECFFMQDMETDAIEDRMRYEYQNREK